MLRVKGQPRLCRDVDIANETSFFENAALVVAQDLSDATEFINETCDTSVGSPHHWAAVFDASKNSVGKKICAPQNKLPGQFADGVLETNQGRDFSAIIRELKNGKFRAGVEILRN